MGGADTQEPPAHQRDAADAHRDPYAGLKR